MLQPQKVPTNMILDEELNWFNNMLLDGSFTTDQMNSAGFMG